MVVAHAGGQDASKKIQVAVAFHIPHVQPFAMVKWQRIGVVQNVIGPQVLLLFCDDFILIRRSQLPLLFDPNKA